MVIVVLKAMFHTHSRIHISTLTGESQLALEFSPFALELYTLPKGSLSSSGGRKQATCQTEINVVMTGKDHLDPAHRQGRSITLTG
jgi:hypothetical protein